MTILLAADTAPDLAARYAPVLTTLADLLPDTYPLLDARHHGLAFSPQTAPDAGIELSLTRDVDDPEWVLLIQDPAVVPAVHGDPDPDGPHWIVTLVTDRWATFTGARGDDPDAAAVLARDLLLIDAAAVAGAR